MLDRIHVVRGGEYQVDGETWWVHVIHRLGSGESVTLCDCSLVEYDRRLGRSPVETPGTRRDGGALGARTGKMPWACEGFRRECGGV